MNLAENSVAILLAVPVDFGEFEVAIRMRRDYVSKYARDPGQSWSRQGGYRETVAEPISALVSDALARGARVFQSARLADLTAATQASSIVIVFAHWKGEVFSVDDIDTPDGKLLFERLANIVPRGAKHAMRALRDEKSGDKIVIARLLNQVLSQLQTKNSSVTRRHKDGIRPAMLPRTARSRARLAMDDALRGLVRSGECMEFADGLFDAQAIGEAIAPGFEGVLDLTACNSMILADELDRIRAGSVRCVEFEQLLPPDIAALMLRQTFSNLSEVGTQAYLVARKSAIEEVALALRTQVDIVRRSRPWWSLFSRG